MNTSDYFRVLKISPTNNRSEIKKAYRKLALKYHPDRNPSPEANSRFIQITEAYDNIIMALDQSETVRQRSSSSAFFDTENLDVRQTMEERMRRARERYEWMERMEELENEKYYQRLISEKYWKALTVIMIVSTLLSVFFTINQFLPTYSDEIGYIQPSKIRNDNFDFSNLNLEGEEVARLKLNTGESVWISRKFFEKSVNQPIIIERTFIFKDIRQLTVTLSNGKVYSFVPSFNPYNLFPLWQIFLCFPLFTYFIKGRTILFTMMMNFSLYVVPLGVIFLLFQHWRFVHIFGI